MRLVRYEPWSLVSRLHDDINRTFAEWGTNDTSSATADWVPAADIEEYVDRFELYVDLPGIAPDDVEITLEGGVLTLAGSRSHARPSEPISRHRRERGEGQFYRRFILPDSVNGEKVEARGRDGVLEIVIPKQAAAQPRRIKVAA
jgi:HSP20 family protein